MSGEAAWAAFPWQQNLAATLGGSDLEHSLGFCGLSLKLLHFRGGAGKYALRLKGDRVGHRAGLKGLHHGRVVFALHLKAHVALLTVADAVSGVGGKAHVRMLLPLEIVGHVVHANLLRGAKDHPQLPLARNSRVLQSAQTVQGHNRRSLVVRNAPAIGKIVVNHHGIGVGVPALPSRHHIQVSHHHGVALSFAIFRVGGVIAHVFCLQAIALRQLYHCVQSPGAVVPKGMLSLLGLCHRGNCHHRGQVFQNVVPIVQDLFAKQHSSVSFLVWVSFPLERYVLTINFFCPKVKSHSGKRRKKGC